PGFRGRDHSTGRTIARSVTKLQEIPATQAFKVVPRGLDGGLAVCPGPSYGIKSAGETVHRSPEPSSRDARECRRLFDKRQQQAETAATSSHNEDYSCFRNKRSNVGSNPFGAIKRLIIGRFSAEPPPFLRHLIQDFDPTS